ncbi:hypothetical protein [Enterococcus faecalis]|uniref:hypothetical protein n=1 Tax=Enterococcus faecalis TaxID=1351 RepID=UPI0034D2618B
MKNDLLALLFPLFYSTFGAGLLRSFFFGRLRRLIKKGIRLLLSGVILVVGWLLFRYFWF